MAAGRAATSPPSPPLCTRPACGAERNAATIMATLRDAQDSLERVSAEAAAATKGQQQAHQDLSTVRHRGLSCSGAHLPSNLLTNAPRPEHGKLLWLVVPWCSFAVELPNQRTKT